MGSYFKICLKEILETNIRNLTAQVASNVAVILFFISKKTVKPEAFVQ